MSLMSLMPLMSMLLLSSPVAPVSPITSFVDIQAYDRDWQTTSLIPLGAQVHLVMIVYTSGFHCYFHCHWTITSLIALGVDVIRRQ